MRSRQNIIIIEQVMQKRVPDKEVKVTLTITELCKFIEAARVDERLYIRETKGQYETFRDRLNKAKKERFSDYFGAGLFD